MVLSFRKTKSIGWSTVTVTAVPLRRSTARLGWCQWWAWRVRRARWRLAGWVSQAPDVTVTAWQAAVIHPLHSGGASAELSMNAVTVTRCRFAGRRRSSRTSLSLAI